MRRVWLTATPRGMTQCYGRHQLYAFFGFLRSGEITTPSDNSCRQVVSPDSGGHHYSGQPPEPSYAACQNESIKNRSFQEEGRHLCWTNSITHLPRVCRAGLSGHERLSPGTLLPLQRRKAPDKGHARGTSKKNTDQSRSGQQTLLPPVTAFGAEQPPLQLREG